MNYNQHNDVPMAEEPLDLSINKNSTKPFINDNEIPLDLSVKRQTNTPQITDCVQQQLPGVGCFNVVVPQSQRQLVSVLSFSQSQLIPVVPLFRSQFPPVVQSFLSQFPHVMHPFQNQFAPFMPLYQSQFPIIIQDHPRSSQGVSDNTSVDYNRHFPINPLQTYSIESMYQQNHLYLQQQVSNQRVQQQNLVYESNLYHRIVYSCQSSSIDYNNVYQPTNTTMYNAQQTTNQDINAQRLQYVVSSDDGTSDHRFNNNT